MPRRGSVVAAAIDSTGQAFLNPLAPIRTLRAAVLNRNGLGSASGVAVEYGDVDPELGMVFAVARAARPRHLPPVRVPTRRDRLRANTSAFESKSDAESRARGRVAIATTSCWRCDIEPRPPARLGNDLYPRRHRRSRDLASVVPVTRSPRSARLMLVGHHKGRFRGRADKPGNQGNQSHRYDFRSAPAELEFRRCSLDQSQPYACSSERDVLRHAISRGLIFWGVWRTMGRNS